MKRLVFKRNSKVILLLIMQIFFMITIISEQRTQSIPNPIYGDAIISSTWVTNKYEKLTMWVKV
ncbi:MAG: hypothetical protein JXA54_11490 [Candidatus Heimdallarchaeota archaeon]|nr:hypothetical protein [Candidatus Heimdallarchaeota archaeon]